MKARRAMCGFCGKPRPVRLDGRFREHLRAAWQGRCAGTGRVAVIPVGEAEPGDVIEFAGGRQVHVATVLPPRDADFPACYVTIRHDPAAVPAGVPVPVLTVCFADTLVRLAGTVMAAPVPAGEGVAA